MKCMHVDCELDATCAPKLMVPATGYALEAHQPMGLSMGAVICDAHFATLDAHEMLEKNPRLVEIFEHLAKDKAPPDFKRAYLQRLAVDSEEFLVLQKASEEHAAQTASIDAAQDDRIPDANL